MPDTTDPVAAYLAEVRNRSESRVLNPGSLPITHPGVRVLMESAGDVPRLTAALEAARDLITTWDHQEQRLTAEAAAFDAAREHPILAEMNKARAAVYAVCAGKLEMALQAALLGEGSRAGAVVTGTGPRPLKGPPPDRVAGTREVP